MPRTAIRLALLLSLVTASPGFAASFVPLQGLPGGDPASSVRPLAVANGISDDGTLVVGNGDSSNSIRREAAIWTTSGSPLLLGDLAGGGFQSSAIAASADGSVVVGRGNVVGDSGIDTGHAFRWTASGGMVQIISNADGWHTSGLYIDSNMDVSADGSVIVGTGRLTGSGNDRGFRWTENGGVEDLGTLPGQTTTQVLGISADGLVIVGSGGNLEAGGNDAEAFRWTQATGMIGLGHLGGTSLIASYAADASEDGSVIVGISTTDSTAENSGYEAFVWTEALGMIGLGDVAGGRFESHALAVSADGTVVVGSGFDGVGDQGSQYSDALYWKSIVEPPRTIADMLIQRGVDLTGWRLTEATGVSADGRVVVGNGTNGGFQRGWIAFVPEPGTGLMVALGLIGLAGRRRLGSLSR